MSGQNLPRPARRASRLRMVCRGILVIFVALAGCQILSLSHSNQSKYVDAIMEGMKRAQLTESRRAAGGS